MMFAVFFPSRASPWPRPAFFCYALYFWGLGLGQIGAADPTVTQLPISPGS